MHYLGFSVIEEKTLQQLTKKVLAEFFGRNIVFNLKYWDTLALISANKTVLFLITTHSFLSARSRNCVLNAMGIQKGLKRVHLYYFI